MPGEVRWGPATPPGRWIFVTDGRGAASPRTLSTRIDRVSHRRPDMAGTGWGGRTGITARAWRATRTFTAGSSPMRRRGLDGMGGVAVEERVELRGDLLGDRHEPRTVVRLTAALRRRPRRRRPAIPADQADQQHPGGGEQHEREPLNQWITAVDQGFLDACEAASVEQPVRAGHGAEQDQRGLDDSGEHPGLPHREYGGNAAQHIQRSEDPGQLLAA